MKLSNEELNKIMMKADDDLDRLKDRCHDLYEENERLKELCDEYEEEHSNEFQCWKKDRKELLDKRERIQKTIEYIKKQKAKMYKSRNKIAMYVLMKVEDILKGDDK